MDLKNIAASVESARNYLDSLEEIREEALKVSRDIIRLSGKAITAIHTNNVSEAEKIMQELEKAKKNFMQLVSKTPELLYSGFTNNALGEYVEAALYYEIVKNKRIPHIDELGVPVIPFLLGLGDLVGELKRRILELIRNNDYENAWQFLEVMEDIYNNLRRLDYPEPLAPGLRHKADVARRLVDDTKAFLMDLESRKKLTEKINNFLDFEKK